MSSFSRQALAFMRSPATGNDRCVDQEDEPLETRKLLRMMIAP